MVHVNARFLTQPLTGVQRYAYETCKRLPEAALLAPDAPLPAYSELPADRVRRASGTLRGHLWEQVRLPLALPRGALLWSPCGAGPLAVGRQALTIHDASHLEHPEWYAPAYARWYGFLHPRLARRVRRILTDSDFCRGRLAEILRVPAERIVVAPCGVDPRFRPRSPEETAAGLRGLGLDGPYILAVSAVSPRKNLDRLLAAWERTGPKFPDVSLAIVGRLALRFSGDGALGRLPARTALLEDVSDETLACLYAGATALAYPSLYEGFGLPPLEAMACGTPVLTSHTTSLPEVCGEAALYVEPTDVEALSDGLRRLLEDAELRASLRVQGLERAREFTWERTAEIVARTLREAEAES